MTVLEMQSRTQPTVRWTEICATEHTTRARPTDMPARSASAPSMRSMRSTRPVQDPSVRSMPSRTSRSVAPGRRTLVRPASTAQVRSCRVAAPAEAGVVDDVPTWVLLACGVVFGLILMLAFVLVGGPTYG